MVLAERIRAAVESTSQADLDRQVTISIGIATFPVDGKDFHELLIRALYEARALGRNKVFRTTAAGKRSST